MNSSTPEYPSQSGEPKVSASSARMLIRYLTDRGHDLSTIEHKAGMALSDLDDPEARIANRQYIQLWEVALELSGDTALGLKVGEQVKPDEMGIVGHIFFNNPTLGGALTEYARYYQAVNESMDAEFFVDGELACLVYRCHDPAVYSRPVMDRTMAVSIVRARSFIHSDLRLEYVSFEHPEPEYAEEYERIFKCPVRFEQPSCAIIFKAHYLDFKLPHHNPYVHKALSRHVESILNRLRTRKSLTRKVRQLVAAQLSSNTTDAEDIAGQLHMSRHTLYRKLKAEGEAFQDLIEDVRKEKALQYLEEGRYNLSEIAYLLGFSELSAFSRAFKRWTGQSPANYIKSQSR